MHNEIEPILHLQSDLGEGPVWDVRNGCLYSIDIDAKRAFRFDPTSGELTVVDLPFFITALGLGVNGQFILATERGIGRWEWGQLEFELLANPESNRRPRRFNDGAVDIQGRFWVGMLGYEDNPLYRFDPDGTIHLMDDGIRLSNGIHWSPDNGTMYLADSLRRVIYAYNFEGLSGSISNRRVAVDTSGEDGLPDGITVDSEGCIWVAMCNGWQILRYDPDGKLERRLRTPVECPTSCTFGGPALNELYITSSRSLVSSSTVSHQPHAGDLFRLRLEVKGQRENIFGHGKD